LIVYQIEDYAHSCRVHNTGTEADLSSLDDQARARYWGSLNAESPNPNTIDIKWNAGF
jgi:hypothetical protein